MSLKRRHFLRNGLLAAGGLAVGKGMANGWSGTDSPDAPSIPALTPDGRIVQTPAPTEPATPTPPSDPRKGVPGRKWVMVVDLAECAGCPRCVEGCAAAHFVPSDRDWLRVLVMRDEAGGSPFWFPQACYHCDDPPCTKVCPVGATFKRDDGLVLIDNTRCIGCRFCMAACPYGARSFNWSRPNDPPEAHHQGCSPEWGYPRRVGTVEKCDFCPDRGRQGLVPHCVESCPMGALYYGDQNEDAVTNSTGKTVRLSELIHDRAGYRYMEELGTEPRTWYLPPTHRRYPAPGEPGAENPHADRATGSAIG